MITLDEIKNSTSNNLEFLDFCKKDNKNIVIMPSGAHAMEVYTNYLLPHNIKCKYFVDNNPTKWDTSILGAQVVSLDRILSDIQNYKIVFATNLEIFEKLKEQIKNIDVDYFYAGQQYCIYSISEIENTKKHIYDIYDIYDILYNVLEDDLSKKTLDNHLKYRLDYANKDLIKEIQQPLEHQYFEDTIYKISKKDSICDCGAFNGDTLSTALKLSPEGFKNYYAFEPDNKNFSVLSSYNYDFLKVYPYCVYSSKQTLYFEENKGPTSKLSSEKDGTKMKAISLDEMLNNQEVTFIKMDIEGAELEAIKGATKIIQSQNPVLAICVYHKFNDLFDIWKLIDEINPNYKFYLRHYTNYISETVLYAIPNKE